MLDRSCPWLITLAVALATGAARADSPRDALGTRTTRAALVRAALARSPALRAAGHREQAARLRATANGRLPDPELTLDVWQVPVSRPYALGDAGMVMVGVKQAVPAPGSLAAREAAGGAEARMARAERAEAARALIRDVSHAFADYLEASTQHHVHERHVGLAERVLQVARARHAAGGPLADVAQAEVELSRSRADAAGEAARLRSIRRRLNALLGRPLDAPLGPPSDEGALRVAIGVEEIERRALESRPELELARARRAATEAEQRALDREASAPSFSVGGLYFPPAAGMREHGYGASLSVSLPWVWGGAGQRRAAQRESTRAARAELEQARQAVHAEVATSLAVVESTLERLGILKRETLPASRRSLEVALAGYETGSTSLVTLLSARRSVVDVELEIVMTRAMLDHALADLDFAAGGELPKKPADL